MSPTVAQPPSEQVLVCGQCAPSVAPSPSGRGGARLDEHSLLRLVLFLGTAVLLYVRASFTASNVCSVGVCAIVAWHHLFEEGPALPFGEAVSPPPSPEAGRLAPQPSSPRTEKHCKAALGRTRFADLMMPSPRSEKHGEASLGHTSLTDLMIRSSSRTETHQRSSTSPP